MVAVGIFCGNTFISNAGAAIGPGTSYAAQHLVGIEIRPQEATRARRNVETLLPPTPTSDTPTVEILAMDGIEWLRQTDETIDLLYLDADGPQGKRSIYREMVEASLHALRSGSIVLAHNSVNAAHGLSDYLSYVRSPEHFRESVNMVVDDQGLEVSIL
jgi:predicted O-methyltransferase YrrM